LIEQLESGPFKRRPGYEQNGSEHMERLEELIRILSEPAMRTRHSKAKTTHSCKICDGPALCFRDAASAFEYKVSAICQECQDKYLCAANRRQFSVKNE
jgi:hypothetical protein